MCECVDVSVGEDSHVMQDTPATVRVSRAQTLGTCGVLFTGLHRNLDHLEMTEKMKP